MSRALLSHLAMLVAPLAVLTATTVLAISPPQTPVEPRYELVNVLGANDVVADIATDISSSDGGRPAILFYDTTTAETSTPKPIPLRLARYDRFSWVSRTFGLVNRRDLTAPDARDVRLSFDETGKPHALVIEGNGAGVADDAVVYFSTNALGAEVREQIDVGNVSQIALTIEHFGEPYIAYIKNQGASGGTLVIRHRAGGAWTQLPMAAPTNAFMPTLAPLPAQANFLGVRLAWIEYATNSSVLRHAYVSADSVMAETVASNAIQFSLSTPQLVVDRFGTAEVAYVSSINILAQTIELRRRLFNQPSWTCIDTGCALPTGPIAAGFTLSAHAYVQGALNFRDASSVSRILRREGVQWVNYAVADVANAQGSALDRLGNVYTTGIDRSTHRDLFAVRVGGPWESRGRIPFDSNTVLSHPLDVTSDVFGRPVIYARRSCCTGDPRGALWLIDQGTDFVELPLPGSFTAAGASVAYSSKSGIHVAIYDSDQGDLVHARYAPTAGGSDWTIARVDTEGDVGLSPTMLIGPDDTPIIVYRRRPDLLHVAAQTTTGNWLIRTLSAGVPEGANPVAIASREVFAVHASWFDEGLGRLRVSTRRGDLQSQGVTSTDTVPTPAGRVRGRVHDIAPMGDGEFGVAFSDETNGQSQMAYVYRSVGGAWTNPGSQPVPFSPDPVTRISLDSTLLAPGGARIAWIAGGRLRYAEKHVGFDPWDDEDLGTIAPNAPMQLGAAGPLRITYNDSSGLFILERSEALGADNAVTEILGRGGGFSYCVCFGGLPTVDPGGGCFGANSAETMAPAAHEPAPLGQQRSSQAVLADLRALFLTTPAGRYYLQLFAEHAREIIRLTLTDPALLIQRTRSLSDMVPGFTALVESPVMGGQYRFKPELIANARAVWQGWASAGSPALAAAVNNELARTNNLNQFTGMTFTQWFSAISVGNATENLFDDSFE